MIKDMRYGYMIKPLIRIVKYWNVLNGKIFDSYEIENKILNFTFFGKPDLEMYFLEFMVSLNVLRKDPNWKRQKLISMQDKIWKLRRYKIMGLSFGTHQIFELLPDPNPRLFSYSWQSLLGRLQ